MLHNVVRGALYKYLVGGRGGQSRHGEMYKQKEGNTLNLLFLGLEFFQIFDDCNVLADVFEECQTALSQTHV